MPTSLNINFGEWFSFHLCTVSMSIRVHVQGWGGVGGEDRVGR